MFYRSFAASSCALFGARLHFRDLLQSASLQNILGLSMLLSDKWASIRENSAKRVLLAAATIIRRATEELRKSGILESVIKVDDMQPNFTLLNHNGIPISSALRLAQGPLVVTLFRGSW